MLVEQNELVGSRGQIAELWVVARMLPVTPEDVDWPEATRVSVSSAQDLLSGWEALCEYPLATAVLEGVIVKPRGPLQVYVLCCAIGGYRIRPIAAP